MCGFSILFFYFLEKREVPFDSSMYLAILITCNDLKIWMGNVPTHHPFGYRFAILPLNE